MDINNLVYSYYDGINIRFASESGSMKFWTNVYGGLLVNDNYLDDEETIKAGLEAGFTEWMLKLDKHKILNSIANHL